MKNNIILLGFMGCGKSTVGKTLAKQLNFDFCDCDSLAEQRSKKTVSQIFADEGEAFFRKLETKIITELCSKQGQIIATGGGAVLNSQNVEALRNSGIVVFLDVSSETVLKRLSGDTSRPLLAREDKETAVKELMTARYPLYSKAAHITINANSDAEDVAKKIIDAFTSRI